MLNKVRVMGDFSNAKIPFSFLVRVYVFDLHRQTEVYVLISYYTIWRNRHFGESFKNIPALLWNLILIWRNV